MNIKELKAAIENLPDDMEVIICRENSDNGYWQVAETDSDKVFLPEYWKQASVPYQGECGECYEPGFDFSADELEVDQKTFEEMEKVAKKAFILYPP